MGKIPFIALCCLISTAWASTDSGCGDVVPLARAIANPVDYHGKAMWVVVYITTDFEYMTACPSENETQMKNCLWININDGSYKTEQDYPRYQAMLQNWQRFNRQTVAIHATFDKNEKGHFSMWPGGLTNVTEVSGSSNGWSFVTKSVLTYNCMNGK